MIKVTGLSDEIHEAMMLNAQKNIVEKILTSASYGQTSCEVSKKGITPSLLSQLENEGLSYVERELTYKLFWEF